LKEEALARKRKSEQVRAAFLETQGRRATLAAEFKAKLLAELGPGVSSASRDAMISAAVSAYVEVVEVSALFLSNRAKPSARGQLSIARGQLQRALRSLGVIDKNDDDTPEDVAAELKRIATVATRESEDALV